MMANDRPRPAAGLLFFLLLLFFPFPSQAEEENTGILAYTGKTPIAVTPANKITLTYLVTNTGDSPRTVRSKPDIPDGWRIVIPDRPFSLEPGETSLRLVPLYIPGRVRAGRYAVSYTVWDEADPTFYMGTMVTVDVLPETIIGLKIIESPEYAIAGEPYRTQALLTNDGNVSADINIRIRSRAPIPYTISPAIDGNVLTVPEWEAIPLDITFSPDKKLPYTEHAFEIIVTPPDGAGGGSEAAFTPVTERITVDVIPRKSGGDDILFTYPFRLDVTGTGHYHETLDGSSQVKLSGNGYLDEDGSHRLSVELQKKIDSYNNIVFHPQDSYTVRYRTDYYDFLIGDHTYSLSPLLEYSRYGRGVHAKGNIGPFRIGSYYHASPSADSGTDHYIGGYAGYRLFGSGPESFPVYSVDLNLLGRLDDDFLFGAYQEWNPLPSVNMTLDAAGGSEAGGALAPAFQLTSSGDFRWWTYSVTGLYADPHFPGYYRDMYMISGAMSFRLLGNSLYLKGLYRLDQRNLLEDPSLVTAPLSQSFQIGGTYYFAPKGPSLNTSWILNNRVDLMSDPDFDRLENILSFTYSHPFFDTLRWYSTVELGYRVDTVLDSERFSHKYITNVNYRITRNLSFWGSLFYEGKLDSLYPDLHTFGVSASGGYTLGDAVISLKANNNYGFTETGLSYIGLILNGGFVAAFENSHRMSVDTSYQIFDGMDTFDYNFTLSLLYSIPFEIPVGRKKDAGRVKGIFIDSRTGKPLKDIIVRLGKKAVITDASGTFSFAPLSEGTYYLDCNLLRLGTNLIPTEQVPIEAIVEKGKDTSLTIYITEGGSISGRVLLYGFKQKGLKETDEASASPEYTEAGGMQHAILQLSDGNLVKRRVTDREGNFSFEEIIPGRWTLHLIIPRLPDYYYIEEQSFTFDFVPGRKQEIVFRVLPQKRTVRLIEEKSMTLEMITMDEETDETRPEATPLPADVTETTPQPKPVPEDSPETTPGPTPGATPVPTPEQTAEITPVPAPEQTPEPAASPAPSSAPEATPVATAVPFETPVPATTPEPSGPPTEPVKTALPTPTQTPRPAQTPEPSSPSPLPYDIPEPSPTIKPDDIPEPSPTIKPDEIPPPRRTRG
ncbi:MAG: hypothetical protein JW881_10550 [Spirochaetales bacterium]|nr:hypothetical protein [Spirochaetales bacterium]